MSKRRRSLILFILVFVGLLLVGCNTTNDDNNNNENNNHNQVENNNQNNNNNNQNNNNQNQVDNTEKDTDLKYLLFSKSEEKQKNLSSQEYYNFVSNVSNFSTNLTEKMYLEYSAGYDRMVVSPISIYMALAMATSVAETEAQTELANLLGISYEDILEYTKYLYSKLNKELYDDEDKLTHMISLNNSIWLNEVLNYKQEGLDILKNSLYTDSYAAPFTTNNKAANKAVQDYVCRNTKGLINNEYNFSEYTLFLLINTLYLKDAWSTIGEDLKFTTNTYDFKNKNNTTKTLNLLMGEYINGRVQSGDGFEYFYTNTAHNLKFYFIKPTTKSLEEVYNSNNLNMILNDTNYDGFNSERNELYLTRCLFPEFDASFDEDIVPLLKDKYGISKIFRDNVANYDKITDENCVTGSVIHQTKLIVDKTGVEGAAVTIIANEAESDGPSYTYKYYDFILDQSFGFVIAKDNTILFSGVVNNL